MSLDRPRNRRRLRRVWGTLLCQLGHGRDGGIGLGGVHELSAARRFHGRYVRELERLQCFRVRVRRPATLLRGTRVWTAPGREGAIMRRMPLLVGLTSILAACAGQPVGADVSVDSDMPVDSDLPSCEWHPPTPTTQCTWVDARDCDHWAASLAPTGTLARCVNAIFAGHCASADRCGPRDAMGRGSTHCYCGLEDQCPLGSACIAVRGQPQCVRCSGAL